MILVPAAGRGQRFRDAGYDMPKHLIPLAGKPLIRWVMSNLKQFAPWDNGGVHVVTEANVGHTRGTAETIAKAFQRPPRDELLIGNCDQLLTPPETDWRRGDAVIFTFHSTSPDHSYVLDAADRIWGIYEKKVVSDRAVSGVYWFRDAKVIIDACARVCDGEKGELYLSRAIEQLVVDPDLAVYAHTTPTAILGTPEDFQRFQVAMELCRDF